MAEQQSLGKDISLASEGTSSSTNLASASRLLTTSAGVIVAPQKAEMRSLPVRMPSSGEILVRIEGCGICGSNLPVWEGRPWFNYPLDPGAPGHEAWGVVEIIGAQVSEFAAGDRVALLSDHGFAEFEIVPTSKALLLPEALADTPFPGEPLACGINVTRRSAIKTGERIAIVGIGFLGALVTKLCKLAGAHVTAISRRTSSLGIAHRFGADTVIGWADARPDSQQMKIEKGFDCVIEAVGTQTALDLATNLTKERGRLVIAGYHQDSPRQVDMQLWNWRGLDVINAHERDPQVYLNGMRGAVDAIVSGALDPSPLYTHRFPLTDLGHAFEMLRTRPAGFMKALVMP